MGGKRSDTTGTPLLATPVNVGTYTVQAEFAGDALHTAASETATITITARSIEVTADGLTKTYGAADPDLTYRITDGSLAFTDAFFGELAREAGEDVGSYARKDPFLCPRMRPKPSTLPGHV